MMRFIAAAALALVANEAAAATWRVDADAACPGSGAVDDPWCSLDEALSSGQLGPGDILELAESDDPYPAQGFTNAPDGTADDPIVLQPAAGEAPIIGGELFLDGLSYWTLRGLTIDAREDSGRGIVVRSSMVSSYGVVLENNTVLNATQRSIRVGSSTDLPTYDPVVRGNHINGGMTVGIELFNTVDGRVLDNDVEGVACSTDEFFQQEGITVIFDNVGTVVAGNYVHDFPPCSEPDDLYFVGIRVRRSTEGEIHHNLVEIDPTAGANFSGGISVHENSFDYLVHHNVVRGITGCGLCDGADFGAAGGNTWAHNTVVDAEPAMALGTTTGAIMFGNALRGRAVAVAASAADVVTSSQANAYANETGSESVVAVANAGVDTSQWQADCNCDDDVVLAEPQLSTLDGLTPEPDSPLVDAAAGSNYVPESASALADVGALQTPVLGSAAVSADGLTVAVEVEVVFPPLQSVVGCAGIELQVDDEPMALAACSENDTGFEVALVEPLWRDEAAVLVHHGVLADSTGVGARLGARVPVFSLELDTTSLDPRPESSDDTTGGDDDDDAETTGSGSRPTSGADDDAQTGAVEANGDDGCTCSHSPAQRGGLLWVLFVLARRRAKTVR